MNELNTLQTQIEDLTAQFAVLKKYHKVKSVTEELKKTQRTAGEEVSERA